MLREIIKSLLLSWEQYEFGVCYDPTSPNNLVDPYIIYEELRRKDPIHRMRLIDAWVLTRYADAEAVLLDHKRFSSGENRFDYTPYRTMLDLDPPDHTRLRSLVSKAFTPRSVAALENRVHEIADELLDEVADKDRIDLMEEFAAPFPIIVIAEMLGVPAQDRELFKQWSDDISLSIEPILTKEQVKQVNRATDEVFAYFEGIIAERKEDLQDDLLSGLLVAEEEGDRLSHEEVLSTMLLLLVAGNETTRNLIGNGMYALLKYPDQLERLRQHPELMESAIDELLRYDSPVQFNVRVVREDVQMKGRSLRRGQKVISLIGAANRDPVAFSAPDVLDIARKDKSHLSFGRGIHYCLGSPLALLEGRIAFSKLLDRFSKIELASEPTYKHQVVLRGLNELLLETGT